MIKDYMLDLEDVEIVEWVRYNKLVKDKIKGTGVHAPKKGGAYGISEQFFILFSFISCILLCDYLCSICWEVSKKKKRRKRRASESWSDYKDGGIISWQRNMV